MNIAHILDCPINSFGGLPLLTREIAVGLASEFETVLLCPSMDDQSSQVEGVTVITWDRNLNWNETVRFIKEKIESLGIRIAFFHGGDFSWGPANCRLSIFNRLQDRSLVRIFVNQQSTPLFSNFTLADAANPVARIKRLPKHLLRWLLKFLQLAATDIEISVSAGEHKMSKRRYFLFRHKFLQIYHSRISRSEPNRKLKGKENVILSMGHFAYRKGQHVLLEAFGRIAKVHPTWKLKMVGATQKDKYWRHLQQIMDSYQIHDQVELIAGTSDPDPYFLQASIYVQPSLVEAYGAALQEAMHFGCGCVGAATGGIPDSVTNPNLLFRPGDSMRLASILDELISNDTLRSKVADTALLDSVKLKRNRNSMLQSYRELVHKYARDEKS